MAEHQDTGYNSNPFRAAVSQLSLLLKNNPISTLTLGLLMLVVLFGGMIVILLFSNLFSGTFGNILAVVLTLVYIVMVAFRFTGASYYLHQASREGRALTARQAIDEVGKKKNYTTFILTSMVAMLAITAGLIAFIAPGLFLLGRLVLAPYIALYEDVTIMEAFKQSWNMTEGHWFEMFGASVASSILLPLGLLSFVGQESGVAARYFELKALKKSGAKAPEAHWMNYVLTGFAIIFVMIYGLILRDARKLDSNNSPLSSYCDEHPTSLLCEDSDNDTIPRNNRLNDFYNSTPAN